LPKPSGGCSSR